MKAAIVIPTNRPARIIQFCEAWASQFADNADITVIVVEDRPSRTITLPDWVKHYCHEDIDADLGDRGRCIPRMAGGVRSFGFWLAAQDKAVDMIISLDDDVTPKPGVDLVAEHWQQLETPRHLRWWQTADIRTRGYPYSTEGMVKPVLNHGLWQGMPDLDAIEQMKQGDIVWEPPAGNQLVPPEMYYTNCIMNVAFRPSVAPYLFMPPLPQGMRRWDDIWSGIIFKRIADDADWAVTSGAPIVLHERASTIQGNLSQEFLGYGINEELWKVIDNRTMPETPGAYYREIAYSLREAFPILTGMADAMLQWADLWETPCE